jgi:ferrous-iron efflux pump FieF
MSVAHAHDVMEEIEAELAKEFPGVDILIHVDPEGQIDRPDNPLVERIELFDVPALGKQPRRRPVLRKM